MSLSLRLDREADLDLAATELAQGRAIAHGFGNFYAITARPDLVIVRDINRMKGRSPDQAGSITTTPWRMESLFDWSRVPAELPRARVCELMERLYLLGPFGFRGPARDGIPDHLTALDDDMRTTQVIYPGLRCPANGFIVRALQRTGEDYLYTTSGNRSRHQTGAEDEPVHFLGEPLAADFAHEPNLRMLHQADDAAAIALHPTHDPMSTTILAFHCVAEGSRLGRPVLLVERHGSLEVSVLAPIVDTLGFGLVLGPKAAQRLTRRVYAQSVR